jgi:threonine dehydrogenase-like Zn-dependent dehydrogenase
VIIKVSATAICGSDLHMYVNGVPGMEKGDIMGHEFMGTVQEVGPGEGSCLRPPLPAPSNCIHATWS